MLEKWSNKRPKDWPRVLDQEGLLADLDFPDRGPDLLTHRVIATISAAVNKLSTLRQRPATSQIVEVVDEYAREYRVPSSSQSTIVSLLEALCSEWEPAAIKMIPKEEIEALTQDGEVPLNSIDEKFTYFVWIDERVPEVLIDRKKMRVTQTHRRLLIYLLENYGTRVWHETLWNRCHKKQKSEHTLSRKPVNRWIADLHNETEGALTPFIIAVEGEGYRFDKEKFKGKKFCVIYHRSK